MVIRIKIALQLWAILVICRMQKFGKLSNLVNQFVPIYQTILDTVDNPNEISNIYQLLDNITEELNASGNDCELEFMANNQFILTTYTSNGNCIINVLPGGANINCSVGICGTANLLYTDTYNFY